MNRRNFFRGVAAAAATVALDPVPAPLKPSVFIGMDPGLGGSRMVWTSMLYEKGKWRVIHMWESGPPLLAEPFPEVEPPPFVMKRSRCQVTLPPGKPGEKLELVLAERTETT